MEELIIETEGQTKHIFIDVSAYTLVDNKKEYINDQVGLEQVFKMMQNRSVHLTNFTGTDGTKYHKLAFK